MVWQSKTSVNLHAELRKPMLTIDGEAGSRQNEKMFSTVLPCVNLTV